MDLLKLIKSKCISFRDTDSYQGIEAVIHHIEIAEKHFDQATTTAEYLYTDVIYRTNQAFEGALKEAYRVFTGEDPSKKSPFQIEKHLEGGKLLKERVLAQFRNYREEWRNQSTHDYQLFFSSQEALLAITSVTAFFSILLDHMLEKHTYETEKKRLADDAGLLFSDIDNYDALDFMQQSVELITHFAADFKREAKGLEYPTEYAMLGKLSGFIAAADPKIAIYTDEAIEFGTRRVRIDLMLKKGDKSIIVELKRPSTEWTRRVREGIEQVKGYLAVAGSTEGIVFVPPRDDQATIEVSVRTYEEDNVVFHIAIIAPGMLHNKGQPTS
jgi:hypothetical protein